MLNSKRFKNLTYMKKTKVVIVLPAYNASKTLLRTLDAIPQNLDCKLLLVDDASNDDTVAIAKKRKIRIIIHPQNRGYGGNQKTCYTMALNMGADIVIMLHPDFQYNPKTIPKLIDPIRRKKADFTFGSRFTNRNNPLKGKMPFYRYLGNRITTSLENFFLGTNFSELHSGLRAYNKEVLRKLPFHSYSDDFVFDSQFVIDAVLKGFKIEEVSIPTHYDSESSSISVSRSLIYIVQTMISLIKKKYFGIF